MAFPLRTVHPGLPLFTYCHVTLCGYLTQNRIRLDPNGPILNVVAVHVCRKMHPRGFTVKLNQVAFKNCLWEHARPALVMASDIAPYQTLKTDQKANHGNCVPYTTRLLLHGPKFLRNNCVCFPTIDWPVFLM